MDLEEARTGPDKRAYRRSRALGLNLFGNPTYQELTLTVRHGRQGKTTFHQPGRIAEGIDSLQP